MKKVLLIGTFLAAASLSSAVEVEVKLGADLYRDATRDALGNNPVKAYPGGSLGAEILVNEDSPFRFGLGAEAKTRVRASDGYDGHYSFPVYAVGKYDFAETWYGVARAGYAFVTDGGIDYADDADGGFYGALGLGKEFFNERFNVELLYEVSEYEYQRDGEDDEDGYLHGIALKFGYKFGGPSPAPAPEPVIEPVPVVEPEPIPEPVVVIPEGGLKFREGFEFDSAQLKPEAKTEIAGVATELQGYEGTVTVQGHTDSVGREAYNQKLSEERAEAVATVFEDNLQGEAISVESEGFGETKPLVDNDTAENRALNRRVEVFWTPAN